MKYEIIKWFKKEHNGRTVYRIKATKNFGIIKKGDVGGWVEGYKNLSQTGTCWIDKHAVICGSIKITGSDYVTSTPVTKTSSKDLKISKNTIIFG